jgi:hypothetical protein
MSLENIDKPLQEMKKLLIHIKQNRRLTYNNINTFVTKMDKMQQTINSDNIDLQEQKKEEIRLTLRDAVRTVLTTPTSNHKTFSYKKKFLSGVPNIMFIDLKKNPINRLEKYLKKEHKQSFFDLIIAGGAK